MMWECTGATWKAIECLLMLQLEHYYCGTNQGTFTVSVIIYLALLFSVHYEVVAGKSHDCSLGEVKEKGEVTTPIR